MRIPFTLLLCGVVTVSSIGCSNDPVGPNNSGDRLPKTGSSFVFDYYDLGGSTPAGTATLIAGPSGVTYHGKSNVVVYDFVPDLFLDSMAFAYASNGDFESQYSQFYAYNDVEFVAAGWTVMGTTNTATNRTLISYDTSATIDGQATTFSLRRAGSYVGTETMTVGGTALTVHKSAFLQTTTIRGGRNYDEEQRDTVWYAPSIGMMAKWSSLMTSTDGTGGQTWMLKSYVVK